MWVEKVSKVGKNNNMKYKEGRLLPIRKKILKRLLKYKIYLSDSRCKYANYFTNQAKHKIQVKICLLNGPSSNDYDAPEAKISENPKKLTDIFMIMEF